MQWGIGNGAAVRIMGDHWIPSTPPELLQTMSLVPSSATVKCLLNEDQGSWCEETVRAFFQDEIANEILLLPVGRHGEEDYVRWPHTKFGEYSVRSAYNLARTIRF